MKRFLTVAVLATALGATTAHAQIAGNPDREKAFNALLTQATAAPHFNHNQHDLDVYRVKLAAGLLLDNERFIMGEMALSRGIAVESAAVLSPLVEAGLYGGPKDPKAKRNAELFKKAKSDAEHDRKTILVINESMLDLGYNAGPYVGIGESWIAEGDYPRAARVIEKALARNSLTPTETAYARLQLGIAQYRAGRVSDARATWSSIQSDAGAAEIAQAWLLVAG